MNGAVVFLLALPLLGFLYCALIGWRLPRQLSGLIASLACGGAFVAALATLLGLLAMLVLVLADNFALLMMGWGGVGVCSYFLISFWFEKPENAAAGVKAFVVNAIGDVGLFLATFLTFWTFGRVDYEGVFRAVQTN